MPNDPIVTASNNAVRTIYAEAIAEAEITIADLRDENAGLHAENDSLRHDVVTYRTIAIEALRRTAQLTDICWTQRIALDDRSRQDLNYSQGTEAHRHLEDAIALRERSNKLRFRAPSLDESSGQNPRRRRAA